MGWFRNLWGGDRAAARRTAEQRVAEGNSASDAGGADEAERCYRYAIEIDPGWSVPWFNLGLECKRQRRWKECLEYSSRAAELNPDDEGACWNCGIAATALRLWPEARAAWRRSGFEIPAGDGPVEIPGGPCPVRLDPEGLGEVVWAEVLDPARSRLVNIPTPESGFRCGDIVLRNGAPNGSRRLRGVSVPVFDVLDRWEVSNLRTFVLPVDGANREVFDALERGAVEAGGMSEVWSRSIRQLCADCSVGEPEEFDREPADPAEAPKAETCAVAARDEAHLQAILGAWKANHPGVRTGPWKVVA